MQCDVCGREAVLVEAIVEGSLLNVCRNCANFGNVVRLPSKELVERQISSAGGMDEEVNIIANDYSQKIKKARESMKLTQADLAGFIAEKESVIHKIESGQLEPTIPLAKKLEQYLRIKLITMNKGEKIEKEKNRDINFSDKGITIGDMLKIKDEK